MSDPIPEIKKVAFIGDYLPRKCGIATFTADLRSALAVTYPTVESFVAPVNDLPQRYLYPPEVRFEFGEGDLDPTAAPQITSTSATLMSSASSTSMEFTADRRAASSSPCCATCASPSSPRCTRC